MSRVVQSWVKITQEDLKALKENPVRLSLSKI